MAYALGTIVKQVVPIIQGEVQDVRYEAATGKFFYHVFYEVDGEPKDRWFEEGQVAEVPAGIPAA
jgi:hypothetical protein